MTPPILIDYREQLPYEFPGQETDTATLEVGDYTYQGFEDTFVVERKSLDDLANSVGTDRLRFENEIRRANGFANVNSDGNAIPGTKPPSSWDKFAVVIEADKSEVYDYRNRTNCPNYFSNIYPNSIIGTIEKWPSKYSQLDFIWAGSREEAKQETLRKLDQWYINYS